MDSGFLRRPGADDELDGMSVRRFLSSYVATAAVGAGVFWLPFWLVSGIAGNAYGGKSVGILTVLVPLLTAAVMYIWFFVVVVPRDRYFVRAILLGVVGPFAGAAVYALTLTLKSAPRALSEIPTLALVSIVWGPLALLTQTGMLGATIVNLCLSLTLGWWLSRSAPRVPD